MTTLCLDNDIQLGNLVLNTVDGDGVTWAVTDVEGWWTIPEPNIPDYPMGLDDGSYDTAGRYGARVFTLSGWFKPTSSAGVASARAKLIAAADLCRKGAWFMTHENDYTKASVVVLSGAPNISTAKLNGLTTFQIGLKAADPIKYALAGRALPGTYSASITGNGTFTATNEGNYPVRPILSVAGSFPANMTVTNNTTGAQTYIRTAGSGTLVVDNKMRSVTLDGARNKRDYLKWDTDWLSLAAGANSISVANSGGTTVTLQWRHGWIG